jgi:hypothetical protein
VSSFVPRASIQVIFFLTTVAFATPSFGQIIPIADSDFSVGNASVGGGLLGGSGSQVISGTPWTGTYYGVAGLLAPPELTISGGVGTISGVAGAGILSVADNGGAFSQTLSQGYQANTTYDLQATVSTQSLLTLNLLASSGVGIGLTAGGNEIANSVGVGTPIVTLGLLGNSNYLIDIHYTTSGTAPTGNIGVELFDKPQNLATANLLSSVTFDNVQLAAVVPEPSTVIMVVSGLPLVAIGVIRRRIAARRRAA